MARTIGSYGPKTMEAIRKAGLRLIFEHGYSAMSLRQLAAAVGIPAGRSTDPRGHRRRPREAGSVERDPRGNCKSCSNSNKSSSKEKPVSPERYARPAARLIEAHMTEHQQLDVIDMRILSELQNDGRIRNNELA